MRKMNIMLWTLIIVALFSGCDKKEQKEEQKVATPAKIKVTKDVVKEEAKQEIEKANNGQFYYSYNKEGESKESKDISKYNAESTKVKTTLDAYLRIKSPYERVQITMMIQKLSHDYVVKCSACHDDYANGVIGPSLLDKDSDFIFARIMDFKNGKRKNILMKELVTQISDDKLKNLAIEIANFNKQIRKMRDAR
ncbi:c-type cytochrome [Sulfurospirillum sp. 1307]